MAIFRGSKTWLALLVVPAFALLYQTLAYAAVPGACDLQSVLLLHGLSVLRRTVAFEKLNEFQDLLI